MEGTALDLDSQPSHITTHFLGEIKCERPCSSNSYGPYEVTIYDNDVLDISRFKDFELVLRNPAGSNLPNGVQFHPTESRATVTIDMSEISFDVTR